MTIRGNLKYLSARTLLLSAFAFASSASIVSNINSKSPIKLFADPGYLQAGEAFNNKVEDISKIEEKKAKRLRQITALIVTKEALPFTLNPFIQKLITVPCKEDNDCKNSKFRDQPVVKYKSKTEPKKTKAVRCTGVLVAPNIIATAAHCLMTLDGNELSPRIEDLRIIFGYRWSGNYEESRKIRRGNIYHGKPANFVDPGGEEIKKALGYKYCGNSDWVLIWLDTDKVKVDGEEVTAAEVSAFVSGDVYMAGYPYALPLKVTHEGKVLDLSPNEIDKGDCRQTQAKIVSDLPSDSVLSGAPIFNGDTVVGTHKNHITATSQASPFVDIFSNCLKSFLDNPTKKKTPCVINVCQYC